MKLSEIVCPDNFQFEFKINFSCTFFVKTQFIISLFYFCSKMQWPLHLQIKSDQEWKKLIEKYPQDELTKKAWCELIAASFFQHNWHSLDFGIRFLTQEIINKASHCYPSSSQYPVSVEILNRIEKAIEDKCDVVTILDQFELRHLKIYGL